jgi:hypothetical protein
MGPDSCSWAQRQRLLRAVKIEWQNLCDKCFEGFITRSRVHLSGEKCGHNSCRLKPGISGSVLEDSLRIGGRVQAKHLAVYEHHFAHSVGIASRIPKSNGAEFEWPRMLISERPRCARRASSSFAISTLPIRMASVPDDLREHYLGFR